jgi:hypothetical protein
MLINTKLCHFIIRRKPSYIFIIRLVYYRWADIIRADIIRADIRHYAMEGFIIVPLFYVHFALWTHNSTYQKIHLEKKLTLFQLDSVRIFEEDPNSVYSIIHAAILDRTQDHSRIIRRM